MTPNGRERSIIRAYLKKFSPKGGVNIPKKKFFHPRGVNIPEMPENTQKTHQGEGGLFTYISSLAKSRIWKGGSIEGVGGGAIQR